GSVGNDECRVAGGVRGVLPDPAYRRRGFARGALERGTAYLFDELRVELGLLLSSEMAVPLYASLGWRVFDGPVWCDQPSGRVNYTDYLAGQPPTVLWAAGGVREG